MEAFVELVVATGTAQNQTFEKHSIAVSKIVTFFRTKDQQDIDKGGNTTLITVDMRNSESLLIRHGYRKTIEKIEEAQTALSNRWVSVCEAGLFHVRFGK